VLKGPFDAWARWHYAAWLDGRRRKREARLQRWIVLLLGKDPQDMLVRRRGIEKAGRRSGGG
jgi:hypothetical protein